MPLRNFLPSQLCTPLAWKKQTYTHIGNQRPSVLTKKSLFPCRGLPSSLFFMSYVCTQNFKYRSHKKGLTYEREPKPHVHMYIKKKHSFPGDSIWHFFHCFQATNCLPTLATTCLTEQSELGLVLHTYVHWYSCKKCMVTRWVCEKIAQLFFFEVNA
jgi:hypothetical protein